MRKMLPLITLFISILFTTRAQAQQTDRFAYSITDNTGQNGNWVCLRKLNLATGTFSESLINGLAEDPVVYDAATKKQITDFSRIATDRGYKPQPVFNSNVAALAYDKKNNRIWYTPMFIDQLRYIDAKSLNVYYVNEGFTGKPQKSGEQGNIVTRMTIAGDGFGYAMTNDGAQLIRFSTGKKIQITDLGSLVDDPANKNISIHNSCSSFGGDMIADDDGHLYIFSARNYVFRVDIATKVATYLGVISGLPNGFFVNGAAVNDRNQVVVGSAADATSLFVLDAKNWSATAFPVNGSIFHTSDLASSNLLITKGEAKASAPQINSLVVPAETDTRISIFPNPVTNHQFTIRFNNMAQGNYTIQVTDVTGRQVVQQSASLGGESQIQTVRLQSGAAKGIYLVKVLDNTNRAVYSGKVVVE